MAILQNNQHHDDLTAKHAISCEDIQFLSELQKELNTQSAMGNAQPVFWAIKESKTETATEDDYDICSAYIAEDIYHSIADFVNAANDPNDNLLERINEQSSSEITEIQLLDDGSCQLLLEHDKLPRKYHSLKDLVELLHDNDYPEDLSQLIYEKYVSRVNPSPIFLTHRAAQAHLTQYDYNYAKDAHAYALTATRSPEFEQALNLIRTINWDALLPTRRQYIALVRAEACRDAQICYDTNPAPLSDEWEDYEQAEIFLGTFTGDEKDCLEAAAETIGMPTENIRLIPIDR